MHEYGSIFATFAAIRLPIESGSLHLVSRRGHRSRHLVAEHLLFFVSGSFILNIFKLSDIFTNKLGYDPFQLGQNAVKKEHACELVANDNKIKCFPQLDHSLAFPLLLLCTSCKI